MPYFRKIVEVKLCSNLIVAIYLRQNLFDEREP